MRRLIFKLSCFVLPFLLLYIINTLFSPVSQGDLSRISMLYTYDDNTIFRKRDCELNDLAVNVMSDKDLVKKKQYDLMVFGDSFSDMGCSGFQKLLADSGLTSLSMQPVRIVSHNPYQMLYSLVLGDFFDSLKTSYVIIESAEKFIHERIRKLDTTRVLKYDSIKSLLKTYSQRPIRVTTNFRPFFSSEIWQIPLRNIQYQFSDRPNGSRAYKVKTIKNTLFSGERDDLMFSSRDNSNLAYRSSDEFITKYDKLLFGLGEMLEKKGVRLINLISPDKYSIYYPFIKNKKLYNEPLFMEKYECIEKSYINLNTYELLSSQANTEQDVYEYYDTHWSSKTSYLVGRELLKILK